nr:hypothetical protein [Mycobacterium avium]
MEPLDQAARERHPLAHGAHHVERPQRVHRLLLGQVLVENGDVAPLLHPRPVGDLQRHPGVVVENR